MAVHVCRSTQQRVLRQFAISMIGRERVSQMGDRDIAEWLDAEGYQSYIEYTGECDDSDDILIAKPSAIQRLVDGGEAFWATRSGALEKRQ